MFGELNLLLIPSLLGSMLDPAIISAVRIVEWTGHLTHKGTINTVHESGWAIPRMPRIEGEKVDATGSSANLV